MIFVAIGTTYFDELIEFMDNLVPTLSEEVIMQIGRSQYEPKNCRFFRFEPSLSPYYQQASLIISHGGLGIVTEVLNLGKPLVTVEDPHQPGRHQREILTVWEEAGHLVWCKNMEDLPQAMRKAQTQLTPYQPPECHIHEVIIDFLDKFDRKAI